MNVYETDWLCWGTSPIMSLVRITSDGVDTAAAIPPQTLPYIAACPDDGDAPVLCFDDAYHIYEIYPIILNKNDQK